MDTFVDCGRLIKNKFIMKIDIQCEAGSLGDIVSTTALLKNGRGGSITLTDEPRIRAIAPVFHNLCEVKFAPSIPKALPLKGLGPLSRRILQAFDVKDYANPHINPIPQEVEWAKEWLKQFERPIIIGPTIGGVNASNHPLRFYRKAPREAMQFIVDGILKNGATPLSFGKSDNLEFFDGAISTPDLPLEKLIAIYSLVKKYIGCDTGDYHVMLAVGGQCITLVPDHAWNYSYDLHHYTAADFEFNTPVRYVNFRDFKLIFP